MGELQRENPGAGQDHEDTQRMLHQRRCPREGASPRLTSFGTTERGWIGIGGGPVGYFLLSGLRVCFRTSVSLLPLLFHFLSLRLWTINKAEEGWLVMP